MHLLQRHVRLHAPGRTPPQTPLVASACYALAMPVPRGEERRPQRGGRPACHYREYPPERALKERREDLG